MMIEITTEELKKLQIKILDQVDSICREKGIEYWIDCGTLLGAIRHKGYIPWDDDIDIGMTRENYNLFISEFNDSADARYRFVSNELNSSFLYPSGKVLDMNTLLYEPNRNGQKIAVNIDVFVYDNAPDDDRLLKKQYDRRDLFRALSKQRVAKYRLTGSIAKITFGYALRVVLKIFPKDYFVKAIIRNAQKYNAKSTNRIGNFTSYSRIACRKEIVQQQTDVLFEGKMYCAPEKYDEWLKAFYGNYMALPPKEERVPHHQFEAYIIEHSGKEQV